MADQETHALRSEVQGLRAEFSQQMVELRTSVQKMAEAVQQMAVLAVQHDNTREVLARALTRIDKIEDEKIPAIEARVQELDKQMPTIKLASSWVFRAAVGMCGLLAVAVGGMALDQFKDGDKTVAVPVVIEKGIAP